MAHRLAWKFATGSWPTAQACHHCDNPSCVRPDHLFDGTALENMTDMLKKNRSSRGKPRPSEQGELHYTRRRGIDFRGENNQTAKLTWDAVGYIREHFSPRGINGKSGAELARMFGVDQTTINKITSGVNWKEK